MLFFVLRVRSVPRGPCCRDAVNTAGRRLSLANVGVTTVRFGVFLSFSNETFREAWCLFLYFLIKREVMHSCWTNATIPCCSRNALPMLYALQSSGLGGHAFVEEYIDL